MEKTKEIVAKIPIQDTRLFHKRWDNYENLNNLLITEIEQQMKDNPKGMMGSNPGCWRSGFKYKCENDLMKAIGFMLSTWCDHYLPRKRTDAEIQYWTNVNDYGGANMFHTHYMADCDVSGVYYVQGKDTGVIRFATHEQMYRMINPGMPYANMIGHSPADGDLLMFPPYLLHDVVPNPNKHKKRISIAFNAKVKIVDNIVDFPKNKEKK